MLVLRMPKLSSLQLRIVSVYGSNTWYGNAPRRLRGIKRAHAPMPKLSSLELRIVSVYGSNTWFGDAARMPLWPAARELVPGNRSLLLS